MRYLLEIAYKGTAYHGWQIQENANTIQKELNQALYIYFKSKIDTIGSGRTDTGVHCEQQFVHFDYENTIVFNDFLHRINAILPKDIVIKNIFEVANNFNARFDATSRSYEYRISNKKNPFLTNLCCFYFKSEIDVSKMNEAAQLLLKHSDFQSFSKYKTEVNHFECTITEAVWKEENGLLVFKITANRFLRGMVRAIVGTLLEIGTGKIAASDFEKIILLKDRKYAKFAAPPEGLFLTKVTYPSAVFNYKK